MDFLDSYLEIEKARFGERLRVTKSVPAEVLDLSVPGLVIQPILENCLKHGVSEKGEAEIEIRCFAERENLHITVSDQGRGVPEEVKSGNLTKGFGLKNINERLSVLYGRRYGFSIRDNTPRGTVVEIKIPLEIK